MLQPGVGGPCLWPGRGKGQRARLDGVDSMAWHIGPTGAQGSGGLWCAAYPSAVKVQGRNPSGFLGVPSPCSSPIWQHQSLMEGGG